MRSSTRLPLAVIAATVLVAAAYAGADDVRIGVAVALVGLAAAVLRGILGIPVSIAMAVASVHAPGAVATIIVVAAALVPIGVLIAFVVRYPEQAGQASSGGGAGL